MATLTAKPKMKKCAVCREQFLKLRSFQKACSVSCALELAERQRLKKWAKEKREFREENKTLPQLIADAQKAFNKYIRERDYFLPCISCGLFKEQKFGGVYDAGHFRSVGSSPHLRFVENNCHKQCVACNQHESGNHSAYRIGLIEKIGIERVEEIEADQTPRHYTKDEMRELKKLYNQKARDAKRAREDEQHFRA